LSIASRQTASEAGQAAAHAAHQQLAAILAPRPGWAGQPSSLIAELAVGLGQGLGLADPEVARIRTAGLLHDVGKITIPEELLSKRTTLTQEEWRMIREHPKTGEMILEQAGALRDAAGIALHHHEWFNGRGYPNGLAARDIPIGARIVAIADAYEAMTSWRPYKRTKSPEEAMAELGRCRGTQFDPELVELFVALFGDMLIAQSLSNVSAAAG
jgi:HD-GYP domain-containing protein (c-di-GMP phosphodiesterase class II)